MSGRSTLTAVKYEGRGRLGDVRKGQRPHAVHVFGVVDRILDPRPIILDPWIRVVHRV